jgi:hypothetical protein
MPQTPETPLVLALRTMLIALDPATGAHVWSTSLQRQIRHVFPVGRALLVVLHDTSSGAVALVDLDSGMVQRRVELAFDPSGAALFENDRLYLASPDGVACVTRECQLVWSGGLREVQRGIFSADTMLVIRGPSGEERAQIAVGPQTVSGNAGLVLGALVSQPDLRD